MVGLPLLKVCFLAVRQVTRPLARRIADRAKDGYSRKLCIGLGRISLGLTGAIKDLSLQQERKAVQEQAKQPAKDTAPPAKKDATEAARIAAPRSRSLLQTVSYGPLPREKYDPNVFIDPGRSTGEAVRIFIQYPYRSMWDVFRRRFLAPYPEAKLVDAGADLLLEFTAFFILAAILSYELTLQYKANARKEEMLYARVEALEHRVARLENGNEDIEVQQDHSLDPSREEEVQRFKWIHWGYRRLVGNGASAEENSEGGEPSDDKEEALPVDRCDVAASVAKCVASSMEKTRNANGEAAV